MKNVSSNLVDKNHFVRFFINKKTKKISSSQGSLKKIYFDLKSSIIIDKYLHPRLA